MIPPDPLLGKYFRLHAHEGVICGRVLHRFSTELYTVEYFGEAGHALVPVLPGDVLKGAELFDTEQQLERGERLVVVEGGKVA